MTIDERTLERIETHAEEIYPEECCGVLLGAQGNRGNEVRAIYRVENVDEGDRSRRYLITPEAYRAADEYAGERGLDIVGVYHSHPDHPARPSETDLERATFPGFSYLITSVEEGRAKETTAWSLAADRSEFIKEDMSVREAV